MSNPLQSDQVQTSSVTKLKYGLEDNPGLGKTIALGVQHVLVMFTAVIGLPLIIGRLMQLPMEQTRWIISGTLLACGIGTLVQARGLGPLGARLPIVMGVFYIFIGPMVSIGKSAGMAAAFTAVFLGGIFEALLSPLLGSLRKVFPPLVTGTFLVIVGVCLLPIAINNAVGLNSPIFAKPSTLMMALLQVAMILFLYRTLTGFWKTISLFLALVAGYVISLALGMVSFASVADAAWFSVPRLMPFGGFTFPPIAGLIAVFFAFVASSVETVGDVLAVSRATGVEPTKERVRGGILVDGLGSSLGALFGSTPLTSYSQNIGVITMTGVGSRVVVMAGGVVLILMSFSPKLAGLISVMPPPVLGGTLLVMFGLVAGIGVDILRTDMNTRRDAIVFATSLGIGLGVTIAPAGSFAIVPEAIRLVVGDGIVMGAFVAVVLNLLVPQDKME